MTGRSFARSLASAMREVVCCSSPSAIKRCPRQPVIRQSSCATLIFSYPATPFFMSFYKYLYLYLSISISIYFYHSCDRCDKVMLKKEKGVHGRQGEETAEDERLCSLYGWSAIKQAAVCSCTVLSCFIRRWIKNYVRSIALVFVLVNRNFVYT